ncbi:TraR/DksA C4-type zinc finger protein [Streptomyces sp. NPDC058960]|uniref:TraR/DksA C4-type zinc finger protein n=1 Tax=Streptomyces sp. NPDC058960 TaxID=3346679 RepID=UPI003685FF38
MLHRPAERLLGSEGSYGACHLCRRPIERERLMILPQVRHCAPCRQIREAIP